MDYAPNPYADHDHQPAVPRNLDNERLFASWFKAADTGTMLRFHIVLARFFAHLPALRSGQCRGGACTVAIWFSSKVCQQGLLWQKLDKPFCALTRRGRQAHWGRCCQILRALWPAARHARQGESPCCVPDSTNIQVSTRSHLVLLALTSQCVSCKLLLCCCRVAHVTSLQGKETTRCFIVNNQDTLASRLRCYAQVWSLADSARRGFLDVRSFSKACSLCNHVPTSLAYTPPMRCVMCS